MSRRHVLTEHEERLVVDAAVRAPSVLNTQPWRFVFGDDRLEIWADPARQLGSADPSGRFMAISCGAATYNAVLAIRYFGHEAWVQAQPRPLATYLAAVIHIGVRRPIASEDLAQYDVIAEPQTNRGPFRDWRLPFSLITRLEESAEAEGAYFRVLTSTEIDRVRRIVSRHDEEAGLAVEEAGLAVEGQGMEEARQAMEGRPWIGDPSAAGAGGSGVPTPRPAERQAPIQDLEPPRHLAARDHTMFDHRPTLAVLSTPGDAQKDWVRAGMALEHVLLTAGLHGVAASFLDAPIERLADRGHLRSAALGLDHPQMVLRLGYPRSESIPKPRRPADQVK
ncbi:Acg family FMN-binding oxidoreductase [Actinopolymorpha pittospori]